MGWNEHPGDISFSKDYGLMEIDEPSPPYHCTVWRWRCVLWSGNLWSPNLRYLRSEISCCWSLAAGFMNGKAGGVQWLWPEEQASKPPFEMKRKLEYNEALSIKLAGQIISRDLHEEEEEDAGMSETTAEESVNSRVYCKVTKCRTDHRVPRRFDTVTVCRIQSLLL